MLFLDRFLTAFGPPNRSGSPSALGIPPKRICRRADYASTGADVVADINQIGILLMAAVFGWLVIFAVRRNRVQWGAFATFIAVVFGVGMLTFLYKADLLAYYAIGVFIGFFSNLIVRAVGVAVGGKAGEGLLEISAYRPKGERR